MPVAHDNHTADPIGPAERPVTVVRRRPPPPLDRLVDGVWQATWDLEAGQQVTPEVVTSPAITLTFEGPTATVTGLGTLRYRRELEGRGRVLGVVFRPGCFRPLLGRPVRTLNEQSRPAAEIFGPSILALAEQLARPASIHRQLDHLVDYFAPLVPYERTTSEVLADVVSQLEAEPDLKGVGDLSRRLGVGRRDLNRLFVDHVGMGPKWVLEHRLPGPLPTAGPPPSAPSWDDLGRELSAAVTA